MEERWRSGGGGNEVEIMSGVDEGRYIYEDKERWRWR